MAYHTTSSFASGSTSMGGLPNPVQNEGIEIAGRTVEKMLHGDGQFPALQDKLRVGMTSQFKVTFQSFHVFRHLYVLRSANFCPT